MKREQASPSPRVHRIAIVGSGPRGLSVLERMAAILASSPPGARPLEIYLIDAHQVGSGRIWRTDQPEWFLMNTVADEVSAFSGQPDDGPARPGAGPSLAQWWQSTDPAYPGANSYAPRALHGRYMQFVFARIEQALWGRARLHKVLDTVCALRRDGQVSQLILASGGVIAVDKVVLVTGHSVPTPQGSEKSYADFARAHPDARYIHGDSAADMPLGQIEAGSAVGVIGLGLSFYDVMAELTLGRGGRFEADGERLRYLPSGREPRLFAGSRSGMPQLARGLNQKDANYRYTPIILTMARALAIRARGAVDFAHDVLPLLLAEINLVYHQTAIARRFGSEQGQRFRAQVQALGLESVEAIRLLATDYGLDTAAELLLDQVAHPFGDQQYAVPAEFERALQAALAADLAEADQGNVDSPLKAALDVIRDTRAIIRMLVDYGGLTPASHRDVFLTWYVARSNFLAAGPPRFRLRQLEALMAAGVLRIIGPAMHIECDAAQRAFVLSSPQVARSAQAVSALIDARIPTTQIGVDQAPLTQQLVRDGIWTSFVNHGGTQKFDTGGVAVTASPYHPIDVRGQPDHQLYVLGIPTEHTRWFMQAGSSRPGFWTDFVQDADAIASDALAPLWPRLDSSEPAHALAL